MIIESNLKPLNYDDIILGISNLEQSFGYVIAGFQSLNQPDKSFIVDMFDNTYVGEILKQLM